MDSDRFTFNRGAVRPMVCLREGWQLIKEDYWLFLGLSFVGALLGQLGPFGILLGPMMCGIHLCLLRREAGLRVSFDMLFKGFDYFLQSFIATLFMIVPGLVLGVVFGIVYVIFLFDVINQAQQGGGPPDLAMFFIVVYGIFMPVVILFSLVLHFLLFFVYPLIVDRELRGVEAVKLSVRAAFGNTFGLVGFLLLSMVLSILGACACYVGAIFFLPLSFAMASVAYRQVFPASESRAFSRREYDDDDPEEDERPRSRSSESGSTAFESQ